MVRSVLAFLACCLVGVAVAAEPKPALSAEFAPPAAGTAGDTAPRKRVVVIPVQEQVDTPLLFIIRRGLKEAIEDKADVVVLDMKTPGGALDVTFDIMEALGKVQGAHPHLHQQRGDLRRRLYLGHHG